MLVSAKEMLNKARDGKYAVGQFNINNLEWTKAILLTAEECKSPVILGVSEGAGKYMCGYSTIVGMVKGMIENLHITVPVALHLDHGTFEGAKACINAGFSSIMFDGSHYPIEENIAKTTALVNTCDILGISLEAEALSVWASALILRSARWLLTWALQCWLLVSVISTASIPQTGPGFPSIRLLRSRQKLATCLSYFTAALAFLTI